jgi:Flp pilus assembly pilin Flp
MRIQCLITRSFLKRYVYEELGEGLNRRLSSHVDRCNECSEREQGLRRVRNQLANFGAPRVSEGEWEAIWNSVMERVEGADQDILPPVQNVHPFPHLQWRARYALLAAAVAVLVVGAALRLVLSGSQTQQTSIASFIQYHEDAVDGHVLLENHFWSAQILPVTYTAGQ